MALPQGINFRATVGFVTDGANEAFQAFVANPGDYPRVTAQGNNVGYETMLFQDLNSRDRNAGNDRRLAGTHFPQVINAGTAARYRIDLPATGSHKVRIAMGEANYAAEIFCELFDTTTSLGVLANTGTTAANNFRDATDTQYSNANWPGSNTAVTKTFATTICRFDFWDGATTTTWAHVYIESAATVRLSNPRIRPRAFAPGVQR